MQDHGLVAARRRLIGRTVLQVDNDCPAQTRHRDVHTHVTCTAHSDPHNPDRTRYAHHNNAATPVLKSLQLKASTLSCRESGRGHTHKHIQVLGTHARPLRVGQREGVLVQQGGRAGGRAIASVSRCVAHLSRFLYQLGCHPTGELATLIPAKVMLLGTWVQHVVSIE